MAFQAALRPSHRTSIHPQAVAFQRLLSVPLCDLHREIRHEVEENPALELAEEWLESDEQETRSFDESRSRIVREETEGREGGTEAAASVSLPQHLWERFALEVSDPLTRRIAYYLINNLNDDGYLCCDLEDAARHFGADAQELEQVLGLVQELEPAGVAARDLRECLLIQLRRLKGQNVHPHAEAILRDHWDAFARRRFDLIARRMGMSVRDVQKAADFIRARLAPYPGGGYRLPWQPRVTAPGRLAPDVIVRKNEGSWDIEIPEETRCRVRLNSSYLDVYQQMRANGAGYTYEERRHVAGSLRMARLFVQALDQRHRTLKRIAGLIVSLEGKFFERGAEGLMPLSQKSLARQLEVSPSTVSRALAHKHLLTPAGELLPFDIFFDRSVLAKEMIRRLVEREEKSRPFSDEDITRRLAGQGIRWARRTVAKYREEIGILSRCKRSRKD